MNNYRTLQKTNGTLPPRPGTDFPSRLRAAVDRQIRRGAEGIDLNAYKDGRQPESMVYRNFSMSDDTYDLGCRMGRRFPSLNPLLWSFWMINSYVRVEPECVYVYQMSQMCNRYTEKELGKLIEQYFDRRVVFLPDMQIKREVEAA